MRIDRMHSQICLEKQLHRFMRVSSIVLWSLFLSVVPVQTGFTKDITPSRPPDPGCVWKQHEYIKVLGIRLLFEDCEDPGSHYELSLAEKWWLEQHRPADDRTYGGPQVLQVFSKPADQSIQEAIKAKFKVGGDCQVIPLIESPVHGQKTTLQIKPTGELAKQLAQGDGKPNCDECGDYTGCDDPITYFEYHPSESQTRYAYIVFGSDRHPMFDENSIEFISK